MTELHRTIHRALDRLVDRPEEQGDWSRVVADAERSHRRTWLVRVAVVAVAAVVAVGAALVSPFEEDKQPAVLRTGVLGKALAAIGDGPVIHLVTRGDWGGDLVDLSTGEVTPVYAESEVWYDAGRGTHSVSRLGDKVLWDVMVPPDEASAREGQDLVALANRYRDELRSGKAKVVARGRVGDRRVLWIRVRQLWLPDVADGKNHLFAEEVAVDRVTYEPVYMRSTRDGVPPPGTGELILKLETLPAGEGDFDADERAAETSMGGAGLGRHLTRDELSRALDGKAVWLGPAHAGKPLAETRIQEFRAKNRPEDEWDVVEAISLFYGSFLPRRGGVRIRDDQKPFVQVIEGTDVSPAWRGSELARDVPDGSVLIDAGGTAFLVRDGVYASISAPEVRDVLAAAAALRRVGEATPSASGLDFDAIARRISQRELVRVQGLARVKPRSLVPRNAKPLRSAVAKGVKVTVYEGGSARFDTRGMEPKLQRLLPDEVSGHCFRVRGDVVAGGAGGAVPKDGVRSVAVIEFPSPPGRRRRPPVARRYDACELGAQFGRNWLPRLDWHWPVELPLTERGRRFFEERAAALELAHFVRNGARKRARRAMKRGAAAPPAASLRDPARPYIQVSAEGTQFTASLTASTGRRFFVEIDRGRIRRSNAKELAFVR
jgi:hypothetical protein